jgi:hypothetical protein
MEFKIPHLCVQCRKQIPSEAEGIHLAPDGITNEYLFEVPGEHLGRWVHAKRCFTKYFEAIDKQRAVE